MLLGDGPLMSSCPSVGQLWGAQSSLCVEQANRLRWLPSFLGAVHVETRL